MSSRYGDRPPPRGHRDLDRDRGSNRRSISPSRRGYGHEDRNGRRYGRRSPPRDYRRDTAATSTHYEDRHVRRDDRYSHRDTYSRKREPSPPTRQARRDEEERKQKVQKEREEEAASIAASKAKQEEAEEGALNGENDEEDEMMKAMGFGGFGTTKGKKVQGNQTGTAEVRKERTWRQYMQRKGGFNRPLSPVRKG